MLELLPPLDPDEPPEEEDEEEEDEEDELGELGEGMLEDDDCWPPAQPPTRNAEMELTIVACTAMTSSRLVGWRLCIARSPNQIIPRRSFPGYPVARGWRRGHCATAELNAR
jgi:hypothetical protein